MPVALGSRIQVARGIGANVARGLVPRLKSWAKRGTSPRASTRSPKFVPHASAGSSPSPIAMGEGRVRATHYAGKHLRWFKAPMQ